MGGDEELPERIGWGGKGVVIRMKANEKQIAGKEQTGQNPLGLDQTGRWGFEGDDKK